MDAFSLCVRLFSFAFFSGSVKLNCYLDEIDGSVVFVLFFEIYEGGGYVYGG